MKAFICECRTHSGAVNETIRCENSLGSPITERGIKYYDFILRVWNLYSEFRWYHGHDCSP